LDRERKALALKQKQLNDKINRACCGFFSCCVRAELSELKTTEIELGAVDFKQRALTQARQHQDHPIVSIKEDLAALDAKLEKLSQTYLSQKDENEKKRDELKLAKNQMQHTLNQAKTRFYSSINIDTMLFSVRAYACFTKLEQTVEALWAHHFAEKKGEPSPEQLARTPHDPFTKLIYLRHQLAQHKTQIEPLFLSLCCPDSGNRTGFTIYQQFLKLTESEQRIFLSGKADAKLKSKLAPYEKIAHSHILFDSVVTPEPSVTMLSAPAERTLIFGSSQ
jgi:hypothetical protein